MYNYITEEYSYIVYIIGLVVLFAAFGNKYEEMEKKNQVVDMWKEQQPCSYWIKRDMLDEMSFDVVIKSKSFFKDMFDIYVMAYQQYGDAEDIAGTLIQKADGYIKGKYVLRNSDTKRRVRTIKLDKGESVNVDFYYDDILLLIEFGKKDYSEAESDIGTNKLVISCIEDTNIATIKGNNITGLQRGTTVLYLLCNSYLWEYEVKVK